MKKLIILFEIMIFLTEVVLEVCYSIRLPSVTTAWLGGEVTLGRTASWALPD